MYVCVIVLCVRVCNSAVFVTSRPGLFLYMNVYEWEGIVSVLGPAFVVYFIILRQSALTPHIFPSSIPQLILSKPSVRNTTVLVSLSLPPNLLKLFLEPRPWRIKKIKNGVVPALPVYLLIRARVQSSLVVRSI